MKYKIRVGDGTSKLVKITSAYFKSWHVWNIKFEDGKAVMLFKLGSEWMQRNEDYLEAQLLNAIGAQIDRIVARKKRLSF
jgi:hypothetical protein